MINTRDYFGRPLYLAGTPTPYQGFNPIGSFQPRSMKSPSADLRAMFEQQAAAPTGTGTGTGGTGVGAGGAGTGVGGVGAGTGGVGTGVGGTGTGSGSGTGTSGAGTGAGTGSGAPGLPSDAPAGSEAGSMSAWELANTVWELMSPARNAPSGGTGTGAGTTGGTTGGTATTPPAVDPAPPVAGGEAGIPADNGIFLETAKDILKTETRPEVRRAMEEMVRQIEAGTFDLSQWGRDEPEDASSDASGGTSGGGGGGGGGEQQPPTGGGGYYGGDSDPSAGGDNVPTYDPETGNVIWLPRGVEPGSQPAGDSGVDWGDVASDAWDIWGSGSSGNMLMPGEWGNFDLGGAFKSATGWDDTNLLTKAGSVVQWFPGYGTAIGGAMKLAGGMIGGEDAPDYYGIGMNNRNTYYTEMDKLLREYSPEYAQLAGYQHDNANDVWMDDWNYGKNTVGQIDYAENNPGERGTPAWWTDPNNDMQFTSREGYIAPGPWSMRGTSDLSGATDFDPYSYVGWGGNNGGIDNLGLENLTSADTINRMFGADRYYGELDNLFNQVRAYDVDPRAWYGLNSDNLSNVAQQSARFVADQIAERGLGSSMTPWEWWQGYAQKNSFDPTNLSQIKAYYQPRITSEHGPSYSDGARTEYGGWSWW